MKTPKPVKTRLLENAGAYVLSALAISIVTTTISFAWTTNTRLTRLETALISLADDVHSVKVLLERDRR